MVSQQDPNTRSNYQQWITEHTTTKFNINFERKCLEGTVNLRLRRLAPVGESKLISLDANYLKIGSVSINSQVTQSFNLSEPTRVTGGALHIDLDDVATHADYAQIEVALETTEKCTALQWLTPEQTSNRKHPYVFTQCQAIHARSVFPCQDTPAVKSTFDNTFTSPLPVLNSGLENGGDRSKGVYRFKQDVPIPSYLYSLASGDIARAPIGKNSEVATGPDELAAAKWELEEDTDKIMAAMSKILPDVPYIWGTYNVLVLPPSFPYGGMENPVWTFATPTVISGDRQNVDVIAHEFCHSFSGNGVSPSSWQSFWLNEGWTTYLERRIQEVLHGVPYFHFSAIVGWKALTDSIHNFGEDHEFTKLQVNLQGKDPDDAFSSVPYEKGFVLLYYLDNLVGRTKWDKFANHYFNKWAKRSLDSFEFKQTLLDFFQDDQEASDKLKQVDWDMWYFKPGFPPKPNFDTSLADVCYRLSDKWDARTAGKRNFEPSETDIKGWSANQVVVFLERVQLFDKPLSPADSQLMGSTYDFSSSKNMEVVARYYRVALQAGDESVFMPTAQLLGQVGRMKFVRPLYRALNKVNRDLAVATFKDNEAFYHPICRMLVQQDLYGKSEK